MTYGIRVDRIRAELFDQKAFGAAANPAAFPPIAVVTGVDAVVRALPRRARSR